METREYFAALLRKIEELADGLVLVDQEPALDGEKTP